VPRYRLVWQDLVIIGDTLSATEGLYTYWPRSNITIKTRDRIGWTYEGDQGLISFNYDKDHHTYFYRMPLSGENVPMLPTVGQTITFDEVHLSAVFSVAIEVGPALPMFAESTSDSRTTVTGRDTKQKFTEAMNISTDASDCAMNSSACDHMCQNITLGYKCLCRSGYRLNIDNHTCDDIDECSRNPPPCEQECDNTVGSYKCKESQGNKQDDIAQAHSLRITSGSDVTRSVATTFILSALATAFISLRI